VHVGRDGSQLDGDFLRIFRGEILQISGLPFGAIVRRRHFHEKY